MHIDTYLFSRKLKVLHFRCISVPYEYRSIICLSLFLSLSISRMN